MGEAHRLLQLVAILLAVVAAFPFFLGGIKSTGARHQAMHYIPPGIDWGKLRTEFELVMLRSGVPDSIQRRYELGKNQSGYGVAIGAIAFLVYLASGFV